MAAFDLAIGSSLNTNSYVRVIDPTFGKLKGQVVELDGHSALGFGDLAAMSQCRQRYKSAITDEGRAPPMIFAEALGWRRCCRRGVYRHLTWDLSRIRARARRPAAFLMIEAV
jgi:hypothetical protein